MVREKTKIAYGWFSLRRFEAFLNGANGEWTNTDDLDPVVKCHLVLTYVLTHSHLNGLRLLLVLAPSFIELLGVEFVCGFVDNIKWICCTFAISSMWRGFDLWRIIYSTFEHLFYVSLEMPSYALAVCLPVCIVKYFSRGTIGTKLRVRLCAFIGTARLRRGEYVMNIGMQPPDFFLYFFLFVWYSALFRSIMCPTESWSMNRQFLPFLNGNNGSWTGSDDVKTRHYPSKSRGVRVTKEDRRQDRFEMSESRVHTEPLLSGDMQKIPVHVVELGVDHLADQQQGSELDDDWDAAVQAAVDEHAVDSEFALTRADGVRIAVSEELFNQWNEVKHLYNVDHGRTVYGSPNRFMLFGGLIGGLLFFLEWACQVIGYALDFDLWMYVGQGTFELINALGAVHPLSNVPDDLYHSYRHYDWEPLSGSFLYSLPYSRNFSEYIVYAKNMTPACDNRMVHMSTSFTHFANVSMYEGLRIKLLNQSNGRARHALVNLEGCMKAMCTDKLTSQLLTLGVLTQPLIDNTCCAAAQGVLFSSIRAELTSENVKGVQYSEPRN